MTLCIRLSGSLGLSCMAVREERDASQTFQLVEPFATEIYRTRMRIDHFLLT